MANSHKYNGTGMHMDKYIRNIGKQNEKKYDGSYINIDELIEKMKLILAKPKSEKKNKKEKKTKSQ